PAAIGDVERARLTEIPHLEVGEVELDGTGSRRDIDVQVVAARHERARARAVHALGARSRLPIVGLGIEQAPDLELALRHALDADRARPHLALSAGATLLPGDGLRSPSERRGAFRREPLP